MGGFWFFAHSELLEATADNANGNEHYVGAVKEH